MKKQNESFVIREGEKKYNWYDLKLLYSSSICFATDEGFETFKKEVLGKDGEVDFNKYLPIETGHLSQALNLWGCLEAYDTKFDDTNKIVRFNTYIDIPNIFVEKWSKDHPNIVFVALYKHDTDDINEVIVGAAYKGGEQETYTYNQTCVTKREFRKNPEIAWQKYHTEFYNGFVMSQVYELLTKYSNKVDGYN